MHSSSSAERDSFKCFFPSENSDKIDRVLANTSQLTDTVERSLRPVSLQAIEEILQKVNELSPLEKLLLYLKLPTGNKTQDLLKQPVNPLGNRVEISQTITWIKTHLTVDKETSLPKQDIYQEYVQYCNLHKFKPLSTADFGKVMKQVYPDVRPRRLGTRGNSRYCYSGVATRDRLETPTLPNILLSDNITDDKNDCDVVCSWASKILGMGMESVAQLGEYILNNNLLPAKEQPPFHNGDSGSCMSSTKSMKLSESPVVNTCGRSTSSLGFKRKLEGEAISSASPVGSQKGNRVKKCSRKGKSGVDIQNSTPATPTFDTSRMHKLPIPRLPKLTVGQDPPRTTTPKRQKPLQPKPTPTEFLENGNSTEQEEELAKYFEGTGGGPKSQLRMLLERNSSGQKKVSFGTLGGAQPSPNTRKKFSFVPISPITPSGGGSLLERMLAQGRSQSVPPPMPPYPTPVEQLEDLQGTTILDPASLSQLFSLIGAELESTPTEEEERSTSATTTTCSSYCSSRGDPVVSAGVSPPPPPLPLLEDSVATGMPDLTLPLVDTFYDFAGEVTHIASCEVPPPDV